MFVAIAGLPAEPSALPAAAALCGLTLMEARSRCAGTLPRILVRQAAEPEARRLVAGLDGLGFRAFAGEARQVPGDAQRILGRQLEWTGPGFAVLDGRGARHDCPAASIALVLPGFRASTRSELVKSTERKFSMGRALLTGGLSVSRKVETVTEQVTSSRESFLLLARAEGQPALILYESRMGFQCLGAELKPSRFHNLRTLLERLRALGLPVDERAADPGYLRGLPQLGVDEVDLGLFLIQAARAP